MAISVGALVAIGIVMLLILVVSLCIGTDNSSVFDTIADKFGRKSSADGGRVARRRNHTSLDEVTSNPPKPGPDTEYELPRELGPATDSEEHLKGEYDVTPVPQPSITVSDTKPRRDKVDENGAKSSGGDTGGRADPGDEGEFDAVYVNTKVKPSPSPRPAVRGVPSPKPKPAGRNQADEAEGGASNQVYQNVRVP